MLYLKVYKKLKFIYKNVGSTKYKKRTLIIFYKKKIVQRFDNKKLKKEVNLLITSFKIYMKGKFMLNIDKTLSDGVISMINCNGSVI